MNVMLLTGSVLLIIIGLIHSMLGEILIFKHLRRGCLIPATGKPLNNRKVRMLRATWHISTIFGWALAMVVMRLTFSVADQLVTDHIVKIIACSMFSSAILVLVASKARHPGWAGLLGVAILYWVG